MIWKGAFNEARRFSREHGHRRGEDRTAALVDAFARCERNAYSIGRLDEKAVSKMQAENRKGTLPSEEPQDDGTCMRCGEDATGKDSVVHVTTGARWCSPKHLWADVGMEE